MKLPDSTTIDPGLRSSSRVIIEISVVYKICVRCGNVTVHNSGLGGSMYIQPLPFFPYTYIRILQMVYLALTVMVIVKPNHIIRFKRKPGVILGAKLSYARV